MIIIENITIINYRNNTLCNYSDILGGNSKLQSCQTRILNVSLFLLYSNDSSINPSSEIKTTTVGLHVMLF